ncbi:MAG: hypothetical protein HQL63_04380 [Magnetococcales bacterium]|nr:hypothetical protein [Magnetococcales bacterium]MBF0321747.1 hypothetical protein [Magnetococcales bacterium]
MPRFERHPWLFLGVVVVCLVVALDLAVGLGYRLIRGQTWHDHLTQKFFGEQEWRVADPVCHHGLAPLVDGISQFGNSRFRIVTNSLGMKDTTPRTVPLTFHGHRIVFIGDSFTEGVGISYPDSYVGRLDHWLRPQGFDVLNAGVGSFSPTLYFQKIRHLLNTVGLRFQEVVVMLDLSDALDEELKYRLDEVNNRVLYNLDDHRGRRDRIQTGKTWRVRWIWDNLFFLEYFRYVLEARQVGLHFSFEEKPSVHDGRRNQSGSSWTFDGAPFGPPGLEKMGAFMDRLLALLNQNNIRLTVGIYPWPDQIFRGERDSFYVRYWKNWCQQRNVELLDLFPVFIQERSEAETLAFVDQHFLKGDVHWNRAGHKLTADFIQSRLEKRLGEHVTGKLGTR